MKKELTGHIRLTPVTSSLPAPYNEVGYCDVMAERFEFSPVMDDGDGGVSWQIDQSVVIDTPDDVLLRFFSVSRQCLVTIYDNSGCGYTQGSRTIPLQVSMSQHLQRSLLKVSGRVTVDPFCENG